MSSLLYFTAMFRYRAESTGSAAVTRHGFGTRVMDGMIRGLNGEICLNWRAHGLACEIAVPA